MRRLLSFALAGLAPALAWAAPNPVLVTHTGRLLDTQDQPVKGQVSLGFKLYGEASGSAAARWSDQWQITLGNDGVYTVYLGSNEGSHPALDAAEFAQDRWLAVSVNGEEMSPRMRVGVAPVAGFARQAGDALTLGGHPASDFLLLGAGGSLGQSVSAGTITATTKFVGTLEGKADSAAVADSAKAPASEFTLDGSKITGTIDTAQLSGTLPGAVTIPAGQVTGALTGATIDASKVTGALTGATIAGSKVSGAVSVATNSDKFGGKNPEDYAAAFHRNLQAGGTFEEGGLYYWRVGAGSGTTLPTVDSSTAHSGRYSVKLFSGGQGSTIVGTMVPVRPGSRVRVSMWAKGNVTQGTSAWHTLYALNRWYTQAGALNGPAPTAGCTPSCPDLSLTGGQNVNFTDWRYFSDTFTVPNDAYYFRINEVGLIGSASGTAWIDDVRVETDSLEDGTEPPLNGIRYALWDYNSDYRNNTNAQGVCSGGWCKVPNRTLAYVKHRPDSVLRVMYQDTLGTNGKDYDGCRWAITADTTGNVVPTNGTGLGNLPTVLWFSAADQTRYNGQGAWMMQNATHSTLVRGLGTGPVILQVWNRNNNTNTTGECLSGWNANGGYLSVEELVPQP